MLRLEHDDTGKVEASETVSIWTVKAVGTRTLRAETWQVPALTTKDIFLFQQQTSFCCSVATVNFCSAAIAHIYLASSRQRSQVPKITPGQKHIHRLTDFFLACAAWVVCCLPKCSQSLCDPKQPFDSHGSLRHLHRARRLLSGPMDAQ